jgi:excisionase family DNA binding protein
MATVDIRIEEVVQETVERVLAARRPTPWLNVEGAAEHLATTKDAIYALVKREAMPVYRVNGRILFRASELDAWVEDGGR